MSNALAPEEIAWAEEVTHAGPEERIAFCYELMLRMRWFGPESIRELARIWLLSPSAVYKYSLKARESFRKHFSNPEELRQRFLMNLEFIAADALRARKPIVDKAGAIHLVPAPNHAAAVRALDQAANLVGLKDTPQPDDEGAKRYDDKQVGELLELARMKGILSPAQEPEPLLTEGEDNEHSGVPHGLSSEAGERQSPQRIRGRHARRNQDPVQRRDSFGAEVTTSEEPAVDTDGVRVGGGRDD